MDPIFNSILIDSITTFDRLIVKGDDMDMPAVVLGVFYPDPKPS